MSFISQRANGTGLMTDQNPFSRAGEVFYGLSPRVRAAGVNNDPRHDDHQRCIGFSPFRSVDACSAIRQQNNLF